MLPPGLEGLGTRKQWIVHRDKTPINPATQEPHNPHDPVIWTDYATAAVQAGILGPGHGVGFVFTDQDPYWFLDLDHCVVNGAWSQLALQMLQTFPEVYAELSLSGEGLHFIGQGALPNHSCKNGEQQAELYHTERYVAITGNQIGQGNCDSVVDTGRLQWLGNTYFSPAPEVDEREWGSGPVEGYQGPAEDSELINRMMASASRNSRVFGGKATLADLWRNNEPVLAQTYPAQNDRDPYDRSSADAALAGHLAWWTGGDHARVARLMRQSGLVRDKWDHHKSYLERTVTRAVGQQDSYYTPAYTQPQAQEAQATTTLGDQTITASLLEEHFKGCTYITSDHRVLMPDGSILKPEAFKVVMGGYRYSLKADNSSDTDDAFKAFTNNQAVTFPKAHGYCFRPKEAPNAVIEQEGRKLINVYRPIPLRRRSGDCTPFQFLLGNILPTDLDVHILTTYMGSSAQNPGVKFQWAPVLQGTEGNGKSLILRIMANAVGMRYSHLPSADDLDNKFNSWQEFKLFIGIEEAHLRSRVLDIMKVLITSNWIEIQAKGRDQYMTDNYANLMITTNRLDGVPITEDTRRYAINFCKQQCKADIERDFEPGWFRWFVNWLQNEDGFAITADWLHTLPLDPQYDPAQDCVVAPVTSSRDQAIEESRGPMEQDVLDAIEEGRQGFIYPWLSSHAVDLLLRRHKAYDYIGRRGRRTMMQSLGYDWHPALKDGRASSVIMAEGARPKIYVHRDHFYSELTTASDVMRNYQDSQGYGSITETLEK